MCSSYPKKYVKKCMAYCHADCYPMNSYVDPKLEKIKGYETSCSDDVKITIYKDKHCSGLSSKVDEAMTKI